MCDVVTDSENKIINQCGLSKEKALNVYFIYRQFNNSLKIVCNWF